MAEQSPSASEATGSETKGAKPRRTIPGDFSYTATPGKLKTVLTNLVAAERPEIFNKDYIETYLGLTGGSASPIPAILKRTGFVGSDGRPTDLYAKFQSDSARSDATIEGLKKGFSELFKKNTFAHSLPEDKVKDILVEITGLKKTDPVLSQIYGTFDAFRSFIPANFVPSKERKNDQSDQKEPDINLNGSGNIGTVGLSYHINIVLPETKDIAVFNAIFQSLKQNLLS